MFRIRYLPILFALLIGAWLRFHALAREARFHPDEALYNTFARDAVLKGDWMLPGLLDKPPLMIYANALAMAFVGAADNGSGVLDFPSVQVGEFAGRLPNTFVSILTLALTYALARRVRIDVLAPTIALLLMSLSPFAITFSATAFTDVFMTFWMLAALWAVTRNHWGAAGWCLALGIASKQPAVLYLPLILALGWHLRGLTRRRVFRFALALGLGIALLLLWDAARGQATIWQVSSGRENYPTRLIGAEEILPRLHVWLTYAGTLLGPGWLTAALVILAVIEAVLRLSANIGVSRGVWRRGVRSTDLFLIYALAYFLAHWLVAFNTFDRYLLPLLPLLAIPAARGIASGFWLLAADWYRRSILRPYTKRADSPLITHHSLLITLCLCLLLLGLLALSLSAFDASEGRISVGGDLGKHDGIDQLAAYLNSKPVATVIYDHWLGWELGYYLGPWNDKRRVFYPDPQALVADALGLDEIGARYFPVPADEDASAWLAALRQAGFGVAEVYRLQRFVVYELTPPR